MELMFSYLSRLRAALFFWKRGSIERLLYIKEHNIPLYFELLSKWKLCEYLVDIDCQAEDMFFDLMDKLVEQDGITEQLKEENPMLWVQKMNAIRLAAEEIVNAEWIRKM